MSKSQSSQSPSRISFDKIRIATFGRLLFPDRYPSKSQVSYTQPMAKEIPIESGSPSKTKPAKNLVWFSLENGDRTSGKELADQATFGEEKFDSFIGRTKMKMSAPSDIGSGRKTVSEDDSFHEKVSNFIDRAKIKMRATSSMGANGKNVSFK
ncbi:hypothetical protein OSB04_022812 [Centaurea solstitialis]|uniref:Uncharacterized protein n=1 Tax=Centaurea solstitialis TaxID=347529 RepID=A0AA38SHZ6_9ASTR|nr:hypothetical protein OSB04_022812 [Centaurea solstitialis]